MIALYFQARGEKRRGKKGGSPSNEFLESLGPGSSAVGSQGSSDAGEYIRWALEEFSMKIINNFFFSNFNLEYIRWALEDNNFSSLKWTLNTCENEMEKLGLKFDGLDSGAWSSLHLFI